MDPLLWLGWRRGLTQEDLYKHPLETDAKRLLEKFNVLVCSYCFVYGNQLWSTWYVCRYWARELERKEHGGTARLWLVIIKCIWLRLLAQGVLMFLEVSLSHLLFFIDGGYHVRWDSKWANPSCWAILPTISPSLTQPLKTLEMHTCMLQV